MNTEFQHMRNRCGCRTFCSSEFQARRYTPQPFRISSIRAPGIYRKRHRVARA